MKLNNLRILAITMIAALACSVAPASAAIIISQYYEGLSNDKYIELYNSGTTAVDLAAGVYKLSTYSNANREGWKTGAAANGGTLTLTGIIQPGSTYLVAHASAANPPYAASGANQLATAGAGVNFNGDDSTVLWTGATYSYASVVDAMGVTTTSGFADTSFVRKANISIGTNLDFNPAHWVQYSLAQVASAVVGQTERLGYHIPEPTTIGLMFASAIALVIRRK